MAEQNNSFNESPQRDETVAESDSARKNNANRPMKGRGAKGKPNSKKGVKEENSKLQKQNSDAEQLMDMSYLLYARTRHQKLELKEVLTEDKVSVLPALKSNKSLNIENPNIEPLKKSESLKEEPRKETTPVKKTEEIKKEYVQKKQDGSAKKEEINISESIKEETKKASASSPQKTKGKRGRKKILIEPEETDVGKDLNIKETNKKETFDKEAIIKEEFLKDVKKKKIDSKTEGKANNLQESLKSDSESMDVELEVEEIPGITEEKVSKRKAGRPPKKNTATKKLKK